MVMITIKRKFLAAIIASIFIILTGFSIYKYMADTKSAFLISTNAEKDIEIFDIAKGSVSKTVPVNDIALAEAKKFFKGITGVYLKVNAIPVKGYIIKIPFEPKIKVNSHWFNDNNINPIDKLFIVFPEEGTSYLLVLDKKQRPHLFNYEGSAEKLLKSLNFELDKIL